MLIENGVNTTFKDYKGRTALDYSIVFEFLELTEKKNKKNFVFIVFEFLEYLTEEKKKKKNDNC